MKKVFFMRKVGIYRCFDIRSNAILRCIYYQLQANRGDGGIDIMSIPPSTY